LSACSHAAALAEFDKDCWGAMVITEFFLISNWIGMMGDGDVYLKFKLCADGEDNWHMHLCI
jgi:hypothetical protein